MIVFPLIYIASFFYSLKQLISKNKQGILVFVIFGLPIYTSSLSIALQAGFGSIIPFMQPFKELIVLATLGVGVWEFKGKFRPQLIDYFVIAYFLYTVLYVFLPIGQLGFLARAIAFKSSAFFTIVYFTGRLIRIKELYLSKYFHYFLLVIIAATFLLLYEVIKDQHFQTLSGYADYNFYLFNQEPSGNYGLTWTFETATGLKRFASFFANPLEYGAATLLVLAVIAGLYTRDNNRFKPNMLGIIAIVATQLSILLAISRASLASYGIMIFVYALATKNKFILRTIYAVSGIVVLYFILFITVIHPDIYDLVYETITFTNPSSVGHIIAWINAIEAITSSPLGMGLGASGVLAESAGGGTGGENQFLIIGVQTGVITILLYLTIYCMIIRSCWVWLNRLTGKKRMLCLTLLLMKIGFIIPLLTSELESSAYISYVVWLFSGFFVSMIAEEKALNSITPSMVNETQNNEKN
ncbi:MAG: O-antigen ligase domain-containing protein [Pedobacter sp.]|nr:MAG: O-antigen ligase domain-containing protein [Pedobacter sp.]